jgi:integrative and conjugative element protein (TIGR02256 family)
VLYRNPFDPDKSGLLIEDSVLLTLSGFRQTRPHAAEAGGILLGYRRDVHLHIVIATPPGPSDTWSRFRFRRDDESHARIALAAWSNSGETIDYLGEWHTHPESDPRPSTLDLAEWRKICARRKEPMLFLIQGTGRQWVGVGFGHAIKVSNEAIEAVAKLDSDS